MKKLLYMVVGAMLVISSASYASGKPCVGVDGKVCNAGTQNCLCKQHNRMPGQACKDVNGHVCHSGTQGCMCKN